MHEEDEQQAILSSIQVDLLCIVEEIEVRLDTNCTYVSVFYSIVSFFLFFLYNSYTPLPL